MQCRSELFRSTKLPCKGLCSRSRGSRPRRAQAMRPLGRGSSDGCHSPEPARCARRRGRPRCSQRRCRGCRTAWPAPAARPAPSGAPTTQPACMVGARARVGAQPELPPAARPAPPGAPTTHSPAWWMLELGSGRSWGLRQQPAGRTGARMAWALARLVSCCGDRGRLRARWRCSSQ